MRSLLLLDMFFTLPAILAALDSWPSNDESLFSDPDLALDASALPSNELALAPSDQTESPSLFDSDLLPENSETDTPWSFSWDLNDDSSLGSSLDDVGVDNSFELADCSASESLHFFGKSRVRRNDHLGICKKKPDAATGESEGWDLESFQRALDIRPGAEEKPTELTNSEQQNRFCFLLTLGALPWGVCSSGNPADEVLVVMDPIMINGNPQSIAYKLSHCTLCMSIPYRACHFKFQPIF